MFSARERRGYAYATSRFSFADISIRQLLAGTTLFTTYWRYARLYVDNTSGATVTATIRDEA